MAPKYVCAKCGKKLDDGSTGSATIVVTQDLTPDESLATVLWCRDVKDAAGKVTVEGCGTKVLKGVNAAAWRDTQTVTATKAPRVAPKAKRAKR